jgi:hypothetical protein
MTPSDPLSDVLRLSAIRGEGQYTYKYSALDLAIFLLLLAGVVVLFKVFLYREP